jgi:zinc carboxypeptidase/carboxypeptidase M14-like protein
MYAFLLYLKNCLFSKKTRIITLSLIVIMQFYAFSSTAEIPEQKITKTLQGITFDSNYDNGSLDDVAENGTDRFSCTIYVEPGELGTRKYWFRFKMTGVAGRNIILDITHTENPIPVISLDGKKWRRMTAKEAPTTSRVELSFTGDQDFAEIAFFFPSGVNETYSKVNEYIRRDDDFTSKIIGQSFQGRDMWITCITDASTSDSEKHRVWMHSRAHAGEVTSTLTMLGFMDMATEDSYLGRYLRKHIIFNVVPLLNIDGVSLGHTRWDSRGIDPERQWNNPTRIPEVENLWKKVNEFMAGDNPIEVALNMHSTKGNFKDTFFFKHLYPSVTQNFVTIQQRYIDAFDNATPLFDNLSPGSSQLNASIFIESYFWNHWGESVMALTHEGHFYRKITDNEWITEDDYHEIGKAMASALIEYFDLPPYEEPMSAWILY